MEEGQKVITVICTGNICRSPMAERLLAHALEAEDEPFCSFKVGSAGVSAYPGDVASPHAIRALKPVGLDLNDHRSRPLSPHLVEASDLILAMTSHHVELVRAQYPDLHIPVIRFREWIESGNQEVPDPFGGHLDLYVETRDSLVEAIPSILNYLKTVFTK